MKGRGRTGKSDWKSMVNAGTISGILALVLFFTGWEIPPIVHEGIAFVGNLTPALSMIVLGSMLAEYPVRELFTDKQMYKISLLKLIVFPVFYNGKFETVSLMNEGSLKKSLGL